MKKKDLTPEIWQFVMDSSALINIEHRAGLQALEARKRAMLITQHVAQEVAFHPNVLKRDPLRNFIMRNPEVVINLEHDEIDEFLSIAGQADIGPGEASAMAVASKRGLPMVIDERETKATGKARNHGIRTLDFADFLQRT